MRIMRLLVMFDLPTKTNRGGLFGPALPGVLTEKRGEAETSPSYSYFICMVAARCAKKDSQQSPRQSSCIIRISGRHFDWVGKRSLDSGPVN